MATNRSSFPLGMKRFVLIPAAHLTPWLRDSRSLISPSSAVINLPWSPPFITVLIYIMDCSLSHSHSLARWARFIAPHQSRVDTGSPAICTGLCLAVCYRCLSVSMTPSNLVLFTPERESVHWSLYETGDLFLSLLPSLMTLKVIVLDKTCCKRSFLKRADSQVKLSENYIILFTRSASYCSEREHLQSYSSCEYSKGWNAGSIH